MKKFLFSMALFLTLSSDAEGKPLDPPVPLCNIRQSELCDGVYIIDIDERNGLTTYTLSTPKGEIKGAVHWNHKFLDSIEFDLEIQSDNLADEPYDPAMHAPHDAIDDMYNSDKGYQAPTEEIELSKRENKRRALSKQSDSLAAKELYDRTVYGVVNLLADRCAIRSTQGNFAGEWMISFVVEDPERYDKERPYINVVYVPAATSHPSSLGEPLFENYINNGRKSRKLVNSYGIDIGVYDCIHSMMLDLVSLQPTTGEAGLYWNYNLAVTF